MRTKILVLASAILSLGCLAGWAQTGDSSPACSPPPPGEGPRPRMGPKFLERLPEDLRKRFEAARQKAQEDPKIQELKQKANEANRALFDAVRAKMQEIDPGLHDELKQYIHPEGGKGAGADKGPGGSWHGGRGFGLLTPEERDQLKAAHAKAISDPAVQAAASGKKAATTPEERRQASEEYRKAIHDAMLKADPTLEPVLKKLGPPGGGQPSSAEEDASDGDKEAQ